MLGIELRSDLANGGTISHTWDSAGRETLIENRNAAGVGQFIATNTYSPVNNRLTVLELDNTHVTYSYDASSQIIYEARSGTYAYARSYTWDGLGNRLQQYDNGVLTTSTFNKANQLLVQTPTTGTATVSSYDQAGNLIGMNCGGALTTQTWSPENKLVGLVSPTLNETYLCSTDGLRKSQTTAAGTTLFTYDEVLVLLETDTSNNLQARNTDYPEEFGGLASQNRGGASSFYGYDSQGSTRILVSTGGVITDSYSYKAFGEPLQAGNGTVNPHTFVGIERYRQQTNGFYLLEVRLLNPFTGQFTSKDPIGFKAGYWNLLIYVGNSPTRYTDPSGLECGTTCDPFLQPMINKCKTLGPGACFDCAYSYYHSGDVCGTQNQSDYVICVRTNAFCHSHIQCEQTDKGGNDPRNKYPRRPGMPKPSPSPRYPGTNGGNSGRMIPYPGIGTQCIINCVRVFGMSASAGCKTMCNKIRNLECDEIFKLCIKLDDPLNDMCMDAYMGGCRGLAITPE